MWLETFFGLDIWLKTWSTAKNAQNKIGWCSRGASLIRGERERERERERSFTLIYSQNFSWTFRSASQKFMFILA